MEKLLVTLKKSPIGAKRVHVTNLEGLGLRHIRDQRILENTPAVRGMVKKVLHMVDVQMVECDA